MATQTGVSKRLSSLWGAVVLATAAGFSATAAAQDITVTSYGGIWEEAITECYAKVFNKRTGYKANVLIGSPAQWMSQVEANPDDPPINVIVSTQPNVLAAADKGLYEPMTEENVPNLKDVPQFFKDAVEGNGACFDYGAFIITYNKDTVKNPPRTTKELVERTLKRRMGADHAVHLLCHFADRPGVGICRSLRRRRQQRRPGLRRLQAAEGQRQHDRLVERHGLPEPDVHRRG